MTERSGRPGRGPRGIPKKLQLRGYFFGGVFVVLSFSLLIVQLFQLQVRNKTTYQVEASQQQLSDTLLTAARGSIYDATGKVLAKSTIVWNVTADPSLCNQEIVAQASRDLAEILGVDPDALYEKLSASGSQYKTLAKRVTKPVADAVQEYETKMNTDADGKRVYNLSLSLEQTSTREYPYGAFLASVLGFCDSDGIGTYGLEASQQATLAGVDGRLVTLKNAWGYEMSDAGSQNHAAQDGSSLILTIDANVQSVVEKYLAQAVTSNNVQNRGSAIVMEAKTGRILAMATKPDFDPNQPNEIYDPGYQALLEETPDEEYTAVQGTLREKQWKNKAITELYYPGSVFKLITASAGLDSGLMTPATSFNCSGVYTVVSQDYHCAATGDSYTTVHGLQDMAAGIRNSCNIYFIQAGQMLGAERLYDYFNAFGFTEPTGVELPSESHGMQYYRPDRMGPVELASTSFGQAQKITPLQMTAALAAVTNGGYLVTPHIIDSVVDPQGNTVSETQTDIKRQVVSEEVSAQLCAMMETVIGGGQDGYAGRNAYVAGYRIGGKSGTSEQLDEELREYDGDWRKVSSFAAALPINDPEIVILVMLDDPEGANDYASVIVAPVVGNIISEIAPYLGIETDGTEQSGNVTVPNCVNPDSNWSLAQVDLNKKGLSHRLVGSGQTVTWQYPYAGTSVSAGTTIYLYTEAAEDSYVPVPDVTGKSMEFASQMLSAASLNVVVQGMGGTVQSQDLAPGSSVPMGSLVTITVVDESTSE